MNEDVWDRQSLLFKIKLLTDRVEAFESGEKYLRMKELHRIACWALLGEEELYGLEMERCKHIVCCGCRSSCANRVINRLKVKIHLT